MSSDSGMTPERAREIVSRGIPPPQDIRNFEYRDAKMLLQGVAYQEEKAKGLVEALEKIAKAGSRKIVNSEGREETISSDEAWAAKLALAHYRQGQGEK